MNQDIVRVLRILEYTGTRLEVEQQLTKSIHGERLVHPYNGKLPVEDMTRWCKIRATTLGEFPDIMEKADAADGGKAEQQADEPITSRSEGQPAEPGQAGQPG